VRLPAWILAALVLGISACSSQDVESTFFISPTRDALTPIASLSTQDASTPEPIPAENTISQATPSQACVAGLTYIEDISIPDGTVVSPGQKLDKRWRVQNSGSCNWDKSFSIRLISGPGMGAAKKQALIPARSEVEAEIRIIFTAPKEPGVYRSAWQAFDPKDNAFGDPFYIEIVIQ
jgi:Ig-like domain from next to BRCA1 gene